MVQNWLISFLKFIKLISQYKQENKKKLHLNFPRMLSMISRKSKMNIFVFVLFHNNPSKCFSFIEWRTKLNQIWKTQSIAKLIMKIVLIPAAHHKRPVFTLLTKNLTQKKTINHSYIYILFVKRRLCTATKFRQVLITNYMITKNRIWYKEQWLYKNKLIF